MNNKGFTLIELMIVVVIIGILAAIAIPNFISMQDRAKEARVKGNCHTVQLAAEDYAVRNNGMYSVAQGDLEDLFPDSDGDGAADLLENPFTAADEPQFGAAAGTAGQSGIELNGTGDGYIITGFGKDDTAGPNSDGFVITLTNGV